MTLAGYRFKCDYSATEAIGLIILWVIISIVTLGLGLFLMPYYIFKGPINRTTLLDKEGNEVGKLFVAVNLSEIIGHAIIWLFLSIITLGLAMFVYYPSVIKRLLNRVEIR